MDTRVLIGLLFSVMGETNLFFKDATIAIPFIMNYVITGRLWWGFNLESATRFSSQF